MVDSFGKVVDAKRVDLFDVAFFLHHAGQVFRPGSRLFRAGCGFDALRSKSNIKYPVVGQWLRSLTQTAALRFTMRCNGIIWPHAADGWCQPRHVSCPAGPPWRPASMRTSAAYVRDWPI